MRSEALGTLRIATLARSMAQSWHQLKAGASVRNDHTNVLRHPAGPARLTMQSSASWVAVFRPIFTRGFLLWHSCSVWTLPRDAAPGIGAALQLPGGTVRICRA